MITLRAAAYITHSLFPDDVSATWRNKGSNHLARESSVECVRCPRGRPNSSDVRCRMNAVGLALVETSIIARSQAGGEGGVRLKPDLRVARFPQRVRFASLPRSGVRTVPCEGPSPQRSPGGRGSQILLLAQQDALCRTDDYILANLIR